VLCSPNGLHAEQALICLQAGTHVVVETPLTLDIPPRTSRVRGVHTDIVTWPARQRMAIRRGKDGSGVAQFGPVCGDCPLLEQCTTAAGGHSIRVGRHERRIAEARRAAGRAGLDR